MMFCCLRFSRLQTADSLRQEKIKDDQCRAIKAGDTTWGISCRGKSWQLQSFSYLWILDYKNHKDRTKVDKGRGRFWIQVFSYWEGAWLLLVAVILCGLLPSDDHHGEPQPGARCAHVRWIVGLLSLHHAQLSVGIWC